MAESLKVLGVVTAAALLLAVGLATSAQAAEFHTESSEGATITGAFPAGERAENLEEEGFLFNANGGVTVCARTSLHGSMPAKSAESLTVVEEPFECAPFATVRMGECDFVLHASGAFDIAGGTACGIEPIEIEWGTGAACLIKIGPQQGLSGIGYANGGSGAKRDVTATFNVTGIHFTQTGSVCKGGAGTFVNGKLTEILTLKADVFGGSQQGLWIE
jgi:hypothetical protein